MSDRRRFQNIEYQGQIELNDDERAQIENAKGSAHIVGYHASRLMEWEIESVHSVGLLPLTPELVETKIRTAERAGAFSPAVANELLSLGDRYSRVPARSGRVCLTTSRNTLQFKRYFFHQFSKWGGEAIYGGVGRREHLYESLMIGKPCVIKINVDLSNDIIVYENFDLARTLAAVFLGIPSGGSLHLDRILPDRIMGIVTESDPEWVALAPLSR